MSFAADLAQAREELVNPEAAARRAIHELMEDRPKAAISELAHGLGSLARQHQQLIDLLDRRCVDW